MRPSTFSADSLRQLLLRSTLATLPELKRALGTGVDLTVFRKLKELDALTSYSHRGRYYALRESAHFDAGGLWSHEEVWFSRRGTLLTTAEAFVNSSPSANESPANSSRACTSTSHPIRRPASGNVCCGVAHRPFPRLPTLPNWRFLPTR